MKGHDDNQSHPSDIEHDLIAIFCDWSYDGDAVLNAVTSLVTRCVLLLLQGGLEGDD